jgi:hypothetical protein
MDFAILIAVQKAGRKMPAYCMKKFLYENLILAIVLLIVTSFVINTLPLQKTVRFCFFQTKNKASTGENVISG